MNFSPQSVGGTVVKENPHDAMLSATKPYFVHNGEEREETDSKITAATQFVDLLDSGKSQSKVMEGLSTDQTGAMALWLFFPGEKKKKKIARATSILPHHRLQRVLERMRDLKGNLDLETLAIESGYSRSHFLRMFRASTGCTPHRYLLGLRLERAKELMHQKSTSLIDIAAMCGFSSHAHLSKMFRQIVGIPPSEYRRNLRSMPPQVVQTCIEGHR